MQQPDVFPVAISMLELRKFQHLYDGLVKINPFDLIDSKSNSEHIEKAKIEI